MSEKQKSHLLCLAETIVYIKPCLPGTEKLKKKPEENTIQME
jgi:hypothetical protein